MREVHFKNQLQLFWIKEVNLMEKTFVMLKPDALPRGIAGEIIHDLENTGLRLIKALTRNLDEKVLEEFYFEHKGKPFIRGQIDYVKSGTALGMLFEGENAIKKTRQVCGATHPLEAEPGTIRRKHGRFVEGKMLNVIHASDSKESVERESRLFFEVD